MSCPERREEWRQERQDRRRAAKGLRKRQAAEGLESAPTGTIGNGTSPWKTVEEEQQARQEAVEEQIQAYRSALPTLLKRLGKIRDPRNPKTIRRKSTVLLLYGILLFVFQMASRREANRQMTLPQFRENLRWLFPELESVAHQDTLNRLLAGIEVNEMEEALVELIQRFIRKKKFLRYLVGSSGGDRWNAEDGAGQAVDRAMLGAGLTAQAGRREHGKRDAILRLWIGGQPGLREWYDHSAAERVSDPRRVRPGEGQTRRRAKSFRRLAQRMKEYFPRLPILVLLDGLYANGPVVELCRLYHWEFMIVLQDNSLPSVWEEVRGLGQLDRKSTRLNSSHRSLSRMPSSA